MDRRGKLLGGISLSDSLGLEIGALHAPLIQRYDGPVLYVDYAPTEVLRERFCHPGIDPMTIVDVDIVWGEHPLRGYLAQAADFVVASHSIEHVPDLIGWLAELHQALKPGGIVALAMPDKRYTFDVRRPVSLPGEILEAYLQRRRQPSIAQVFDAAALSKNDTETESWHPGETSNGLPVEVRKRLLSARDLVDGLARNPSYTDVHCWVFTPPSFLDVVEALQIMGYFPFEIVDFYTTEPSEIEFIVRLKTVIDPTDEVIGLSIEKARRNLQNGMPGTRGNQDDNQSGQVWKTPLVTQLYEELGTVRDKLILLEAQNEAAADEIRVIRRSHSWRITAPLRAMTQALKKVRSAGREP